MYWNGLAWFQSLFFPFYRIFEKTLFSYFLRFFLLKIKQNRYSIPYIVLLLVKNQQIYEVLAKPHLGAFSAAPKTGLSGGSAAKRPMATCGGPAPPEANP
jgi:hypothetical protein